MRVTVIVPVRNGERYLASALDSLRYQTFSDFELLVVDNGSIDRSGEIAREYGARVIREDEPGLANARNAGIAAAEGEVLAFTDADCRADDRWVEHIVRFFEAHPYEAVVTGETSIPNAGLLADAISALGFPGGGRVGFDRMWRVDDGGYTTKFTGCNFAIRKELFTKVGLFHPRLKSANDDSEMAYRLVRSGYRVRFLPYLLVYHEPRGDLRTFSRWHFSRGRSNYHFKSLVGDVSPFVRLRLWSTMNIVKAHWRDIKIVLILPLLAFSFLLQQAGFVYERSKNDKD